MTLSHGGEGVLMIRGFFSVATVKVDAGVAVVTSLGSMYLSIWRCINNTSTYLHRNHRQEKQRPQRLKKHSL